ncbi:MAG: hypothetical protein ACYDB9_02390 [Gammaproteobacteria bacterium]
MSLIKTLFVVAGALALIYGALILWSVSSGEKDVQQEDWLKSEELTHSKFNSLKNMRHLLQPERQNISFSRSRARGYAMIAVGIALTVLAFI